jgi:uncharacterized membrane protein
MCPLSARVNANRGLIPKLHPCNASITVGYAFRRVSLTMPKSPPHQSPTHTPYRQPCPKDIMAASFAPYQDTPESSRALSPPPIHSPRTSLDRTRHTASHSITSPSNSRTYDQQDYFHGGQSPSAEPPPERTPWTSAPPFGSRREDVDMFTTSLGWRLDYEACLAYLLLPPAGGVLLLMLEHQSDYVRFHAWQSSLLFGFVFVVHVIFSWSEFISWVMVVGDLGVVAWLVYRAWVDAATLERYEVPFFGALATSILDDE